MQKNTRYMYRKKNMSGTYWVWVRGPIVNSHFLHTWGQDEFRISRTILPLPCWTGWPLTQNWIGRVLELDIMVNLRGDQLTMTSTQAPTNDPNTASMSAHLVPGFWKTKTAKIANKRMGSVFKKDKDYRLWSNRTHHHPSKISSYLV